MTRTMDDERPDPPRLKPRGPALPPPLPFAGRANLRVSAAAPHYADMVERAKAADPAEWKWYDGGIQVPVSWYERFRKRT